MIVVVMIVTNLKGVNENEARRNLIGWIN